MPKAAKANEFINTTQHGRGKTKQKLVEAGLELFSSNGFEAVSVSELEQAVGLKAGSGSFYRHFSDKKTLFKTIIEQEINAAKNRREIELDALANSSADIREALKQQCKLTLLGLRENQRALNLFSSAKDHFPALFKVMRKELIENAQMSVLELYSKRIAANEMINADPLLLSTVVQSALFGFHQANSLAGKKRKKDLEEAFIDTLLDLIVAKA